MTKQCARCRIIKSVNVENFYRDSTRRSGFFPWCIECFKKDGVKKRKNPALRKIARERTKKWYESNRSVAANTFYMKRYGLSLVEVRKKKQAQKHRCAICNKFRRLCVDHDHKTGKVRDMLCRGCNGFLGLLENNSGILKRFENYIRRHQ